MEIATIAVMIVAFIGMIVCAKKQKTNPNAKTIAILCLIVVVICAGKFMVDTGSFGGPSREMKEALASYDRFSEASAQAAGELVSRKFAGKNQSGRFAILHFSSFKHGNQWLISTGGIDGQDVVGCILNRMCGYVSCNTWNSRHVA